MVLSAPADLVELLTEGRNAPDTTQTFVRIEGDVFSVVLIGAKLRSRSCKVDEIKGDSKDMQLLAAAVNIAKQNPGQDRTLDYITMLLPRNPRLVMIEERIRMAVEPLKFYQDIEVGSDENMTVFYITAESKFPHRRWGLGLTDGLADADGLVTYIVAKFTEIAKESQAKL